MFIKLTHYPRVSTPTGYGEPRICYLDVDKISLIIDCTSSNDDKKSSIVINDKYYEFKETSEEILNKIKECER